MKEAKAKKEAEIAKRFAAEMGLDSVGQARGVLAGAKRVQRKIAGGNVRYSRGSLCLVSFFFSACKDACYQGTVSSDSPLKCLAHTSPRRGFVF